MKLKFARGKTELTYTIRNRISLETLLAEHEVTSQPSNATHNSQPIDSTERDKNTNNLSSATEHDQMK